MPASPNETYISIDVETAGPNPAEYPLLSIGARTVTKTVETFYVEIQPDHEAFSPEALQISGLDMDKLRENGVPPVEAMQAFADWIRDVTPKDSKPVFAAFNAPFDWMFVNDYFYRYLGYNPFGHSALDLKAFFMGMQGVRWGDTGFEKTTKYFGINHPLTHNALQDALDQAELFRKMLEEARKRNE